MAVNESVKAQNKLPRGCVSSLLFPSILHPNKQSPPLFSAGLKLLWSKGKATLKTEAGGGKPPTRRGADQVTLQSSSSPICPPFLGALVLFHGSRPAWCGDCHFLKRFQIIEMESVGGLFAGTFFSLLPPRYSWYHMMFGFLTSLFVLINIYPFFSKSY